MPNYCNVTIEGHLCRDPDLKFIQSGQAICSGSVAYTESWTDKQTQQKKSKTAFVDFKMWGKLGEWFAEKYRKGEPVSIRGKLEQESWDDKSTGQKRSKIILNASGYFDYKGRVDSGTEQPEHEPAMAAAGNDVPF